MPSNEVSRSWFAVFANPEEHGYTGTAEEIIERLKDEWTSDYPLRKGWWAYCISATGFKHVHMILEDSTPCRFTKIKKIYPKAHLEATKGNKKQVSSYMQKKPPFDEKGERVICSVTVGNIEGKKLYSTSNMNNTLASIEMLIEEGKTPRQIMDEDIKFRREENLIRKCFFAKRYRETPPIRDVKVVWHIGEPGSGKTYEYISLCDRLGDENIYFFSDYANKGVGGFDNYCGEPVLFMDELKQGSLPFEVLLTITQGYRTQIHCRYNNCYSLWDEVHIASIYPPEDVYSSLVKKENQRKDTIEQLLRRISVYVYHYKEEDGKYKTFELPGNQYSGYEDLKKRAIGEEEWVQICENDQVFL